MSEKILVTCPGCSKQYSFEAAKALGKRATCKGCGSQFVIDGGVSKKVHSYAEELLARASSDQSANTGQPKLPEKSEPPPIPSSGEVVRKRTSTRAALVIVAAVALLTLSTPFVAMFLGSILFPKAPIAAVAPIVSPPVVEPEPEEPPKEVEKGEIEAATKIDDEEQKPAKGIDVDETSLIEIMKSQKFDFQQAVRNEKKRVYFDRANGIFLIVIGPQENLTHIAIESTIENLTKVDSEFEEKIKRFHQAMHVAIMVVRPSLEKNFTNLFDNSWMTLLVKEDMVGFQKYGLAVVLLSETNEESTMRLVIFAMEEEK